MSSWTFETYEQKNLFAEYRWNKGNYYDVIVGKNGKGFQTTILFHNFYNNEKSARMAFKRRIREMKKGQYGL